MRDVEWLKPVRPGDTLRGSVEVTAVRRSASKPDRGIVTTSHAIWNQHDELMFRATCLHLVRARAGIDESLSIGRPREGGDQ